MYVSKYERTPEYFGVVARNAGYGPDYNPYNEEDNNHKKWLRGYTHGHFPKEEKRK